MASREPKPCGAASSEWTTSPPLSAASAPHTPCRHKPANPALPTPSSQPPPTTRLKLIVRCTLMGKDQGLSRPSTRCSHTMYIRSLEPARYVDARTKSGHDGA